MERAEPRTGSLNTNRLTRQRPAPTIQKVFSAFSAFSASPRAVVKKQLPFQQLDLHSELFFFAVTAKLDECIRIPQGASWITAFCRFSRELGKDRVSACFAEPVCGIRGIRFLAMHDRVPEIAVRSF